MNKLKRWMSSKKLKINPEKTEIMLIGSRYCLDSGNFPDSINMGGVDIKFSEKVRSLGVLFDETLSMKHHLRLLKSKLINNIINIARISKYH